MDTNSFDRLSRHFSRSGTRRAAFSALLGAAMLGTAFDRVAAKREPLGKAKARGKSARRGTNTGKSTMRVRTQAKTKLGNHCLTPLGQDLNELYGISAQIVAPFCNQVGSGEQWVNTRGWFMEHTFVEVPAGFMPAGETPLEDFIAKFSEVRYVIDPGTKHEKTVVFPNSDALFAGEDEGLVLVSTGTLGTVHPLPVGEHVVDVYWVFNAMHCDGIAASIDENCFPAGETKNVAGLAFTVTPGHH